MIDLSTALGRLLCDGDLREDFRADPAATLASLELTEEDRLTLLALSPEDLEHQSLILRRKRFDLVRRLIPQTCARLEGNGWPPFQAYSHGEWPSGEDKDAAAFLEYLGKTSQRPNFPGEWNLLRFLTSPRKLSLHLVSEPSTKGWGRTRLQILYRYRQRWQQVFLYFGL